MPTVIPVYFWNESLTIAYFVPAVMRYVGCLHATWLVNSVAHMWGWKPYDKSINPVENLLVSIGAIGEGFHNYHHTFPQDYATSEYGAMYFNMTKGFIDFMAFFGLAYNRNKVSKEAVLQRRKRTGDLSKLEFEDDHCDDAEHPY
jgi:stearoyl-CoA desaturase (Delta-9 desaturase)